MSTRNRRPIDYEMAFDRSNGTDQIAIRSIEIGPNDTVLCQHPCVLSVREQKKLRLRIALELHIAVHRVALVPHGVSLLVMKNRTRGDRDGSQEEVSQQEDAREQAQDPAPDA